MDLSQRIANLTAQNTGLESFLLGSYAISSNKKFNKWFYKVANVSSIEVSKLDFSAENINNFLQATRLTKDSLATVLGISRSKLYNILKDGESLEPKYKPTFVMTIKLWEKGIAAFDGNKQSFETWLQMPNTNLGGLVPFELLSNEPGRRELEKALDRIEFSVYG